MLGDAHLQRRDGVATGVADFRARAPVDRGDRQMEQYVEHPRAVRPIEQFVEQLGVLRPDARQGARGGEQGVENGGTHAKYIRGPAGVREPNAFAQALEILSMMRVFEHGRFPTVSSCEARRAD